MHAPDKERKSLAKINIEITATDLSGNKTVKNIDLTNKNISSVRSVKIESDTPIEKRQNFARRKRKRKFESVRNFARRRKNGHYKS
ncbi:MAG: hypothetical protein L6V93_04565 [Clostridiales bacterium]|nr:MAG: hypothetical protein L6V93_04565 [Clostridiales bacterium]